MIRRGVKIAGWSVLGAVLVATAYLLVNTTFMLYDDEGFVLISLRNYLAGHPLYDEVFSQYGPWPYVYHQFVTMVLHAPMTHMLGRGLTIFHWVTASLLCGATAWRLTRRQIAAVVTTIATFGLTWQMTSEPSHPGSLIVLLVALAAFTASTLAEAGGRNRKAACLGVLTALLLLTKINVGLLMAAGIGCIALRHTAWPERWRRPAGCIAIIGLLAIPWLLMGRQLDHPRIFVFAVQFTLCAVALFWVTPVGTTRTLPPTIWLAASLAGLAAGLGVCAIVLLRGTNLDSLFSAILVKPLNQPSAFRVELAWTPGVFPVTIIGCLLAAKAGWELRRTGRLNPITFWGIAFSRLAVLAVYILTARFWPTFAGILDFMRYCLPLFPLFVISLQPSDSPPPGLPTVWLVSFVALPQILHAFPVAGSQMGWASFSLVPVFAHGFFDLFHALAERRVVRRCWETAGWALLTAACLFQVCLLAQTGWDRYSTSLPLGLPGAEDIRVEGKIRQTLRVFTLNASIQADLLFSRPGMYSYNLWSGVPTPTMQNATHWFWLLDQNQQKEIQDRLADTPNTAFIVCHPLDDLLEKLHVPVKGVLSDFVRQHYQPLFSYNTFTYYVPVGSRAAAFGCFKILEAATPDSTGKPPILFRSNILIDGRPDFVRLQGLLSDPPQRIAGFPGNNARIYLEPINRAGEVAGAAVRLPVSQPMRGLYRLSVFCDRTPPLAALRQVSLELCDSSGAVLSESIFPD
jgi:hypothetical protein